MGLYSYTRPAIFLPGDSRRAPAYARRDALRLKHRRASDPFAPNFVRSSWRRSDACMRQWRVGARYGAPLYQKLYLEASFAYLRVQQSLKAASRAARRFATQAHQTFIQSLLVG